MNRSTAGILLLCILGLAGCAGDARNTDTADVLPGDAPAAGAAPAAGSAEWPAGEPVDVRRVRAFDFTGDGTAEEVVVTASGEHYDSLSIALTIRTAAGDTLWREAWTSRYYFVYEPLEGKADTTVQRIVQAHVDTLLADSRFSGNGLPEPLRRGPDTFMKEAVQYSLAELDYRRQWDLVAADALPTDAYRRIDASTVDEERVAAAVDEIRNGPMFMYFAGGEATYALAWSDRENALVRVYSCC